MKKPITQNLIKDVLSQYKRYKLSLSESSVIETISSEISDQLRRNFIIEPIPYRRNEEKNEEKTSEEKTNDGS
tara:strand:- start:3610 stop:3828 length:219 start_codon:yes stop_codon:yes gene_type:complete